MDTRGQKRPLSKDPEAAKGKACSRERVDLRAAHGKDRQGREELEQGRRLGPELPPCCELTSLTTAQWPRWMDCHALSC